MRVRRFDDVYADVIVIDEADDLICNRTNSVMSILDQIQQCNQLKGINPQFIITAATTKNKVKGQDFIKFIQKNFG